jgi:hypothetical protein
MSEAIQRERWFVERLMRAPGIGGQARELIRRAGGGADACLRARRIVEYELNAGPDGIGEWVFRQAAAALRAAGRPAESAALADIADTSGLLAETSREWHGRYLGRPPTTAERVDSGLLESGCVRLHERYPRLGDDGALYAPGSITGPGGEPHPVAVVFTHAGTAEVVTGFRHEYEQAAWLVGRGLDALNPAVGPVTGALDGPWCRTVREELVLAWLLRGGRPANGDAGDEIGQLAARAFTTYARSECYLAWRTIACVGGPGTGETVAGVVRAELARRLLCAPGWAAEYVGWPFGELALAYASRLAATPVSTVQARTAARELIREDRQATEIASRASPASSRAVRLVPRPHPGQTGDGGRLPRRWRPDDPAPGCAPRM